MAKQRVLIAGGGIVGLATAYKLALARPGVTPVVLEKEAVVGQHQTGHNSGVLHAGLYYKPGSNKARLAVTGIREMVRFCEENDIPHDICGKLVVAADESELGRLDELYERGAANGLKGLKKMLILAFELCACSRNEEKSDEFRGMRTEPTTLPPFSLTRSPVSFSSA